MTLAADWIERYLVHGEGDYYGQPFRLLPWQRTIVDDLYTIKPSRALIGLPKGQGKTELAAAIGAHELAGGVNASPLIPVAAASFEQADLVFGAARAMIAGGPLAPFFECLDTVIRRRDGEPGRMYRVAAAAGTADGMRPTFAVFDELHEWIDDRKARVHLVIANGLAKRVGAWELNITTAGWDTDSLLGRMYAEGRKVAAGELDDPSFYFHWVQAADHWNLKDPEQLEAAIREANPAVGHFLPLDNLIRRYREIPENEFRRYHLNQWVQTAVQWLPTGAWDVLRGSGTPPAPGEPVYLGWDGSYNRDASALVGCTPDGFIFVVGIWERPAGSDEWTVPRAEVDAAVRKAFDEWDVRAMVADPRGWAGELERWAEDFGSDRVLIVPQTRPRLVAASSRFYAAVVGGGLRHDGNPTLARHLRNATVKETVDGAYISKAGRNSPNKIDAAMAAVLVFDHAMGSRADEPVSPSVMLV